ncbi:hypothetical protein PspLS_10086 [Pyricularia sp. CBS 133598]|nr:hypothetical protein PspLS_10086 [Pyricularia sp. CBS 133598]
MASYLRQETGLGLHIVRVWPGNTGLSGSRHSRPR